MIRVTPLLCQDVFVKQDIVSNEFQTQQKFIRKQSIVKIEGGICICVCVCVRDTVSTGSLGCGDGVIEV